MLLEELNRAIEKGKAAYQQLIGQETVPSGCFTRREIYEGKTKEKEEKNAAQAAGWRNRFFAGDNRDAMLCLLKGDAALHMEPMAGKINLIYIDPPFDSQRLYHYQVNLGQEMLLQPAYSDRWERETFDYIQMLTERLCLMKDLLAPDGSILVHIDYHISHYVKILLDEIFGRNRFINEIVWCYGGGGAPKKHYTRKHDVILWYSKGKEWFFQPQYRPYRKGTLERGLTAVKGSRYELHREGAALDDWWAEPEVQKILSPTARENMKYDTQKPEGLLRRIIRGHSREGDIVADFFCGSGTTGITAEKMGRRWIMADASFPAFQISRRRLLEWKDCSPWEAERQDGAFEEGKTDGIKSPEGGAKVDLQVQPTVGGTVLQVSLTGYTLAEEQMESIPPKSRAALEALVKEDWLKLIEYWDADSHYQGNGIFHPDAYSIRIYEGKKTGIRPVQWQFLLPWDMNENEADGALHRVAVRIVDILGREQLLIKTAEKQDAWEERHEDHCGWAGENRICAGKKAVRGKA